MSRRAKYDEHDVIHNGHCAGEGCGQCPVTLFRVSQYRYRCAGCFLAERGENVPSWMVNLARPGVVDERVRRLR